MKEEIKQQKGYSLNAVKKLKRLLTKGTWKDFTKLATVLTYLTGTLEEYLKLYISCREFMVKFTEIGEGDKKAWEDTRRVIQTIKDELL